MKLIPLTHGKVAMVDDIDYERVARYKWHYVGNSRNEYARTTIVDAGGSHKVRMHRFIMRAQPGTLVDHEDGNGLNNCRYNIRYATCGQNKMNGRRSSHKLKGVRQRTTGMWEARITCEHKPLYIGQFHEEITAAFAYDRKARELFGEFACPNFHPDYEGAYHDMRMDTL